MKDIFFIVAVMAVLMLLAAVWLRSPFTGNFVARAINSAGTHCANLTRTAEGAIATPHLLVKAGTAPGSQVIVCGAGDEPTGAAQDDAADGAIVTVELLGKGPTRLLVAGEAISADEWVYTAADGKVQDEPTVAGTYYMVGKAKTAATADGDELEVDTITPLKVVVVAALTSTNGTAAAAVDLAALKTEAEKIGDDVRAIGAALSSPALVKVLAS